jgi:hypothetical protein
MTLLLAGIVVLPRAEIEGEVAESRPDAAVEVHLGIGPRGEIDTRAVDAEIEQVVVDLQFGAALDGGLAVRLRDAAEILVRDALHAEGDVEPGDRRSRRRPLLARRVGGLGRTGRGHPKQARNRGTKEIGHLQEPLAAL